MTRGAEIRGSFRRTRIIAACLFVAVSAAAIVISAELWREQAERQLQAKAAETLAVQAEALTGILDKYRLLPPLLSREASVLTLFRSGGVDDGAARRKAIEIHGMSGAKEVAFLYPDGRVLATAHDLFAEDISAQGQLLTAARQGRLGRQAISLESGERIYGFASGVWDDGRLLGILAVYVDFDPVEATWSLSTNPIFVTDRSGLVFLTNRPAWRLKPASTLMSGATSARRMFLGGDQIPHGDVTRTLPLLGWELHVLSDERPLATARWTGGVIAALVCLLLGAVMAFFIQRREANTLRMRQDRAAALRLERLVRERTRALSQTNLSLSHEIEERRQTEDVLRKTQAELVQAAKLAVLGQMSAALSHEFNQPLAALRTYSDNAKRFLDKGKLDSVGDNLTRIGGLVDRMAGLSRSLLSFSRKPGNKTSAVPLGPVLDESLQLVQPRARKAGVLLQRGASDAPYHVLGGHIRLSQVFVNLINNAVDAVEDCEQGCVWISVQERPEEIVVRVEDNGPGIPEDMRAKVFDPFFTTKDVGSGIGIGLSIVSSIVHDFGGRIDLEASEHGGARFAVRLKVAETESLAAE
ncbi:MAG: ATP-binding protein [Alphaproteobacteria bacterium]|nr:ATP-binding protein [Alphaproteobacteria bacterium]